jgi:hypothetical protein
MAYDVSLVLAELRPLSELALRFPLGIPLSPGALIKGGGALNHGLAVFAVVTDHSPRLAGAVVAGERGL